MGITTVLWWLVGYSLCFSGGSDGIYGNFHFAFLRHVGVHSIYAPSRIPLVVLIAYQMMFAIITPALITGAFTNRVTFKAYLIFLVVWQLVRLLPVRAHALGRRPARPVGCTRLRGRHRRARERRLRSTGLGPLRGEAEIRRLAAQHPLHRARHRAALVRLVRLQRRQRAQGRRHHVARVPQHRPRRLVRGDDLAVRRVAAREKPHFVGPAHRRGRRSRQHHAGGRLCPDLCLGRDRHRGGRSSATTRSSSRTG